MSKRVKKERNRDNGQISSSILLRKINPITPNQIKTFDSFENNNNLFLHGYAGTGKTFIATYLSLREILSGNEFDKLTIIRSAVPSRDMGFMPGSLTEKTRLFEAPYHEIVNDLFGRGDAYEILKIKRKIEFLTTSYIRGTTMDRSIILVDECQNMVFQELNTIITRVGSSSKIIFCGDYRQTDLNSRNELSGITYFSKIIKTMNRFNFIEFNEKDIVRSDLVKDYIIKKEAIDIQANISQ